MTDEFSIIPLLKEIEGIISFILRKIDLDNSRFAKNIKIEWVDERIVIDMPYYAIFIDKGRKKNSRMPPIQAIEDFIQRRNITSTELTTNQLAWAISKAIARDGIEPRPFIEEIEETVFDLVSQHINLEINKRLSEVFTKT